MSKEEYEGCAITGGTLEAKEKKPENDTGKISGIYKIVNKLNGKYYVGSSKDICGKKGRWYNHKTDLIKNNHYNTYLQRAWNKYGESSFNFIIVEEINEKDLLLIEQKYLDIAKTEKDKCYNLSFIAGRVDFSEEIIEKIRNTLKIYYSNNVSPTLGKHHSEIIRQKMKDNHVNFSGNKNPRYDDTQYHFFNVKTKEDFVGARMDFINKYNLNSGMVCSLIKGKNYVKSVRGWTIYGQYNPDEGRRRQREKMKGRLPPNTKIIVIDNIKYKSQADAARQLKISPSTISRRANMNGGLSNFL